jgi:hypothetical protein
MNFATVRNTKNEKNTMTHTYTHKKIEKIAQRSLLGMAIAVALGSGTTLAQDAAVDNDVEVIQVRGIVSSLKRAMSDKKESLIVSDGIAAEDLGKFPDLNVAES